MNNNLIILGAGQYGQVARETAEAMGAFDKVAFLDDAAGTAVGSINDYEKFAAEYSYAFVAIGDAAMRRALLQKLEDAGYTLASLVAPDARISRSAQIGRGSIVESGAVVNANAVIAVGCIISANAVVNHDSFVGDCCHIDCNATVGSNVIVYAQTKVESNTRYAMPHSADDADGIKKLFFGDGA